METKLIKYVRGSRRKPVGVVVAFKDGSIGWSKCNFKAGDKWNKREAFKIAKDRSKLYSLHDRSKIPHDVRKDFEAMFKRATKYFRWE